MRISDWSSDVCSSDLALLWVCSASRDRPTRLMSATALMITSQKAAAILSQRVRESRSDGASGRVMAASTRAGLRQARPWRYGEGWRKGRREPRAGYDRQSVGSGESVSVRLDLEVSPTIK